MFFALLACNPTSDQTEPAPEEIGIAAFGFNAHDPAAVTIEEMLSAADGLDVPRDLDFNPDRPAELWVVNRADDSTTIAFDAGTTEQSSTHIVDPFAEHFMEEVSSIQFGKPGTFGTCQESRNTYNGQSRKNDFMGPSLWSSDLAVYGQTNPQAVAYLGYDLGSHLDMLHESPLCMGIAWDSDNVYWVFDGLNKDIVRYDFQDDHGPGYDDHSDGIISRVTETGILRVEDVPSHMELDHETGLLYVADTGNNRVLVLDTATGERGDKLPAEEPGTDHHKWDGAEMWDLVAGAEFGIGQPSGLALHGDLLLVGDYATGNLFAFDLDGELVDWLPTGLTGLMGVVVVSEEEIWVTDAATDRVLRITP